VDPVDVIEHEVTVLMRRAETVRLAAAAETGSGLDRSGYLLLRRLDAEGPRTKGALAQAFGLDVSTINRQVAALEGAGLVRRVADPDGGRASLLEPTEAGRERLYTLRAARHAVYAQITGDWTPDQRAIFADLLHRLNDALASRTQVPPPAPQVSPVQQRERG
jgi:DNA-binding MarR family transcriptional regulator